MILATPCGGLKSSATLAVVRPAPPTIKFTEIESRSVAPSIWLRALPRTAAIGSVRSGLTRTINRAEALAPPHHMLYRLELATYDRTAQMTAIAAVRHRRSL